jgi:hypothetical protein
LLISKLRYGPAYRDLSQGESGAYRHNFDAERALRLVIAVFLTVSFFFFPKVLWFFPWFLGFALTMAGLTGICPMCIFFKKMGFR